MKRYDLVIIGGGVAGLIAASGGARFGASVAIIEKKSLGGDCLNFGCVPTKRLIYSARVAHLARRASEFGIGTGEVVVDFKAVMEGVASVQARIGMKDSREWVASAVKGGRFEELDRRVALQGWKIVALTRLVPIFPYNFLNYAFGLTSIGFFRYIIASFFCMIPGAAAYVALSSSIPELIEGRFSTGFIVGAVLLVTVSVLGLLYKRLGRKRP